MLLKILQCHRRSLDVAEACSPNLHVWVRLQCYITNLSPDMLAFAITIGPDEQDVRPPGLRLDVARYSLFILLWISQLRQNEPNHPLLLCSTLWVPRTVLRVDMSAIS